MKHVTHGADEARRVLLSLLSAPPDDTESFRAAMTKVGRDPAAWQALIDTAGIHGVLGVISHHPTFAEHLPNAFRPALDRRRAVEAMWHEQQMAVLLDAVRVLHAADIAPCVLKGLPLAARLYPDPSVRPSVDVDLLVRPADLDRAVRALSKAGYRGDSTVAAAYLRQRAHHLRFAKPHMPTVELHFHAYSGFGVVIPAAMLMDRAVEHRVVNTLDVLVPAPEDEVIYLAVHAAGHSFIRLLWLYDLKLLLRRFPSLNWNDIGGRAEVCGVSNPLAYTTAVLREWLAVSMGPLPERLGRKGVRARLANRLLSEVSMPQPTSVRDKLGGLLFKSLLCDRLTSSAWLLQHHLLRMLKRRLERMAPGYLPERWSA